MCLLSLRKRDPFYIFQYFCVQTNNQKIACGWDRCDFIGGDIPKLARHIAASHPVRFSASQIEMSLRAAEARTPNRPETSMFDNQGSEAIKLRRHKPEKRSGRPSRANARRANSLPRVLLISWKAIVTIGKVVFVALVSVAMLAGALAGGSSSGRRRRR